MDKMLCNSRRCYGFGPQGNPLKPSWLSRRFRWHECAVGVALAVAMASPVFAAGIDCTQARSNTEKAVCISEDLRKMDDALATLYGQRVRVPPQQRKVLERSQLEWLKQRDQCDADENCLRDKYQTRLDVLRASLKKILAYRPDAVDRQVLEDLRQAVEVARRKDPESPLEHTLNRFKIKTGITEFSNVKRDGSDSMHFYFPTKRPAGVTPDEWRALRTSGIDGGGVDGTADYELLHIDGRAQRDLVVHSYAGGTSLWTFSGVLRRKGDRFVGNDRPSDKDEAPSLLQSFLYSDAGRGANQSVSWINVRGRTYVAYVDSVYGRDDVYLLRPLSIVGQVPELTVRYRYRFSIPRVQDLGSVDGGEPPAGKILSSHVSTRVQDTGDRKHVMMTLDAALHAALTHAIDSVNNGKIKSDADKMNDSPVCPIPAGVTGDNRSNYGGCYRGPYGPEIIAALPVWLDSQCYVGCLTTWDAGLGAGILINNPAGNDHGDFFVDGTRTATGVSTSIAPFDVN